MALKASPLGRLVVVKFKGFKEHLPDTSINIDIRILIFNEHGF